MSLHSINAERRLYVLRHPGGFTCAGFDYAERIRAAVLAWLSLPVPSIPLGTAEHFADYERALALGAEHNRRTGKRCDAELTPRLIGLEGKRVEVSYSEVDGSTHRERFTVGKSTGWMPVHLEIARGADGGGAVHLPADATVRVL